MIEYSMIAESFKFVDTENWSLLPRSRVFDRLFERSKVQMGAHRAGNGHPQGFQRAGRKPGRRITARTRRIYVSCAVTRARLVCYRKLQEAHQPRLADATWANDRGRISLARALEQRHAFAEPSIELAGGREQGTNKKDALNMRRSLRIYSGELLRGSGWIGTGGVATVAVGTMGAGAAVFVFVLVILGVKLMVIFGVPAFFAASSPFCSSSPATTFVSRFLSAS